MRLRRWRDDRSPLRQWPRTRPEPLLVRLGVGAAGLSALLLAAPGELLASPYGRVLLVLFATAPALAPDGRWPTALVLVAVGGWLVATTWSGEPVTTGRLLALAAALYLVHVLAALASALPYDAIVAPDVVLRWLARALAVIVVASAMTAAVLTAAARITASGHQVATVIGLASAAGLAAALSRVARHTGHRRHTLPPPDARPTQPGAR